SRALVDIPLTDHVIRKFTGAAPEIGLSEQPSADSANVAIATLPLEQVVFQADAAIRHAINFEGDSIDEVIRRMNQARALFSRLPPGVERSGRSADLFTNRSQVRDALPQADEMLKEIQERGPRAVYFDNRFTLPIPMRARMAFGQALKNGLIARYPESAYVL